MDKLNLLPKIIKFVLIISLQEIKILFMGNLLIRVKAVSPCTYTVEQQKIDTIFLWFDYSVSLNFGRVIINGREFSILTRIVEYALNDLLNPSGNIIIRSEMLDLHQTKDRFTALVRKLISSDHLEFIAQCTNDKYRIPFPRVKTMLIGIARQKADGLAGKVRYISMEDRLERNPEGSGWFYSGVPFTREECLEQIIHADVPNQEISELHPWPYLPLNAFPEKESQELGEFMELSPGSCPDKVIHGIDHNKFSIGDIKIFDDYTKVIKEAEEKFPGKRKLFYLRKIITDSAVLFRNYSKHEIESLLIRNPQFPIYVDCPRSDDHEYYVSIQVKPECKDIVDIEYIYLETRKQDFMSQFCYYDGMMHTGVTIKSSTILRARIAKLPPLDVQRLMVKKEKEKFFSEQRKAIKTHEEVLGIKKKDISHSIGGPLGEIKRLTDYLNDYFESEKSPVIPAIIVKESKHPYSLRKVLDEIYENLEKTESWINGLGLDINKSLVNIDIHSILTGFLEKLNTRRFKFVTRYNLDGLENVLIEANNNLEFILENIFSNTDRHAFSERSENNILTVNYCFVRFKGRNFLNLSFSNNGALMELSLKEYIEYGTKGSQTGNTGIGGSNIHQIVKSFRGFLGLKKLLSGFSVTFDILLPVDDAYLENKTIIDYEPGEIE